MLPLKNKKSLPLRRLFVWLGLLLGFLGTLGAEYTPLKGVNGRIIEVQVESIAAMGIRAVPRNGYRTTLIRWEQLDLAWFKKHHAALWQQKEQIQARPRVAYEDFRFGDSRAHIHQLVHAKNGFRLAPEVLQERAPGALWVTFDPESLQTLFRFHFGPDDTLNEIQIHYNFDGDAAFADSEHAWKRLVELISGYEVDLVESKPFPTQRERERAAKKTAAAEFSSVTHRWQDDRRHFALSLAEKPLGPGRQSSTAQTVTLFGQELTLPGAAAANPHWVVLVAKLR